MINSHFVSVLLITETIAYSKNNNFVKMKGGHKIIMQLTSMNYMYVYAM